MSVQIFHHNLLDYTGRNAHKNTALADQYQGIRQWHNPDFLVAGFTELLTAGAVAFENLYALAQELDGGLDRLLLVEVGECAGGDRSGRIEFVGIAWDSTRLDVEYAGVAYRNSLDRFRPHHHGIDAGGINALFDRYLEAKHAGLELDALVPSISIPGDTPGIADHRGLAYIAGRYRDQEAPFICGFSHNMYSMGDRTTDFNLLSYMARKVWADISGADRSYNDANVVIGGDFNVNPRRLKRPFALFPRYAYNRRDVIRTTGRNLYDFWLVSNEALLENCSAVFEHTLVRRGSGRTGSDHMAIMLDYLVGRPGTI